ncbi:hypothetical protein F2P81_025357 [Scophthalmus maximus]|uniref:Uncharacterized protein n=1 Tax=Scophthalmus maximus TaxID=52904 RepID=A0A6A4RIV1_SCOMX|nr:hypothetical protein F2P81_025357 [Scophthalmus maximus]
MDECNVGVARAGGGSGLWFSLVLFVLDVVWSPGLWSLVSGLWTLDSGLWTLDWMRLESSGCFWICNNLIQGRCRTCEDFLLRSLQSPDCDQSDVSSPSDESRSRRGGVGRSLCPVLPLLISGVSQSSSVVTRLTCRTTSPTQFIVFDFRLSGDETDRR